MIPKPDTTHHAQERENADPEERIRPVPLAAVVVTLAMVLFGVVYIFISDPFGNASLGDRRTVADLSGPAPAAAGASASATSRTTSSRATSSMPSTRRSNYWNNWRTT